MTRTPAKEFSEGVMSHGIIAALALVTLFLALVLFSSRGCYR
jgi:hypothetical protein